ncbi:MAG: CDP-alcohol phosphatidyltransferase family protein [Coriobacteriia bacterium]|nr:CDP-alcohol phosphatidyltransferase family protein [Coriobacteriia bacterium]
MTEMGDIKQHKRVNDMLLGPLERPALQWMASHSPAWVTPDVLTALGVVGSLFCFAGYWLSGRSVLWLLFVNLGFIINWVGDSLDGTLARYRKIERPKFGFYIDHTVDAVTEFLTIIGIGMSPFLRLDIAAFAMIGYLLMSVHVYVRTAVEGVFKISYGTFGPTELRVIIMLVNTAIMLAEGWFLTPLLRDVPVLGNLLPFDIIGIVLAVALSGVFLGSSWEHAVRLAREGK